MAWPEFKINLYFANASYSSQPAATYAKITKLMLHWRSTKVVSNEKGLCLHLMRGHRHKHTHPHTRSPCVFTRHSGLKRVRFHWLARLKLSRSQFAGPPSRWCLRVTTAAVVQHNDFMVFNVEPSKPRLDNVSFAFYSIPKWINKVYSTDSLKASSFYAFCETFSNNAN